MPHFSNKDVTSRSRIILSSIASSLVLFLGQEFNVGIYWLALMVFDGFFHSFIHLIALYWKCAYLLCRVSKCGMEVILVGGPSLFLEDLSARVLLQCLHCLIPREETESITEIPPCVLTWKDPEESSWAAKILPGQCWISLEVFHKNRVQGFRHVDPV